MTHLQQLIQKYPELTTCQDDIQDTFEALYESFRTGGKLLICGNGGSAADGDHIVGELMKGFERTRPITQEERLSFEATCGAQGTYIADHLQRALPAISLNAHAALQSAFINDVAADMVFAQQVYGYGQNNDTLLGISTSGNSSNVLYALRVAKQQGLQTIGLSGEDGGKMRDLCDVTICVPYTSTAAVQERHLPVYHTLCLMLEEVFFND